MGTFNKVDEFDNSGLILSGFELKEWLGVPQRHILFQLIPGAYGVTSVAPVGDMAYVVCRSGQLFFGIDRRDLPDIMMWDTRKPTPTC